MKTNNNLSILIVDDEQLNIELASVYLHEMGYEVFSALGAKEALEQLSCNKIELILLDVNMPEVDGFTLCRKLKQESSTKEIPVIFLTAQSEIEYISKGFEVGGADYITKPFNADELKARVSTQLKAILYLREIKNKQAKFAQLSITDHLTKLHNALYFDSQVRLLQKKGDGFWFVFIKIDKFEKLNSLYGFNKANKMLQLFSQLLQESAPSSAVVARLHGVHFAVTMKNYDGRVLDRFYREFAKRVAEQREQLGEINFFSVIKNMPPKGDATLQQLYKQMQNALEKLIDSDTRYRIYS